MPGQLRPGDKEVPKKNMLYNNRSTSGSRYIGIIFNTEGASVGDVASLVVVMIGIFGMLLEYRRTRK